MNASLQTAAIESRATPLAVVSVCRTLPTPEDPAQGTFVAHRLAALARLCHTRVLQPVPYFPILNPLPHWARGPHHAATVPIEPVPMPYVPGALKSLDGLWLARSIAPVVTRLARASHVGLIDSHFGYPDGVGCVRVAARLDLPVFVTIRGSETEWLRVARVREQLVRALNAATGCISVSHSLRRTVMEYGVDPERVRVIPNAVDRQLFRTGPRDAARRELGVGADTRLVVSVGHLVRRKGYHVLLHAFAELRRSVPSASLAIIGGLSHDRTYPAELSRLVSELGVSEHVRMLGRVTQTVASRWLQAADVYALATSREGCCNSVLEALAAGLPVVTTPVGDNAHYVRSSVNGFLVPVGESGALARALADALGRQWDAQAISRGLDVGNWDDVARRVLDFFHEKLLVRQGVTLAGIP